MIVLDASVLIAYLDARDQHPEAAEQLLVRSADDEFGANALTVDTAVPLAGLRAMTGLRMPDCCGLLAAEVNEARIAVRALPHPSG